MLWKYKKCYQEDNDDVPNPCTYRYLGSVSALIQPPVEGETDCSNLSVTIGSTTYTWNSNNSGQIYTIDNCVDESTILMNTDCTGNYQFNWDDDVDCCGEDKCYTYRATAGSIPAIIDYKDCNGLSQEVLLNPSGNVVASFCAKPSTVTSVGGANIIIIEFSCVL